MPHPEGEAVEAEVAAAAAGRGRDVGGLAARRQFAVAGVEHAQAALVAVDHIAAGECARQARVDLARCRWLAGLRL